MTFNQYDESINGEKNWIENVCVVHCEIEHSDKIIFIQMKWTIHYSKSDLYSVHSTLHSM